MGAILVGVQAKISYSELADDLDRSAIFDQVQMGVAVRMACLKTIVENKKKNAK